MAHHRIPLAYDFAIWRDFALRGAGFPARLVDRLRDREASAAADAHVEALRALEIAWTEAERVVDVAVAVSSECANVATRIRGRRLPKRDTGIPEVDAAVAAVAAASALVATREAEAGAALERATGRAIASLAETAQEPRLREAITWQNPRVIDTALDPLARHPERRDSATRQHAQLAASYLQRYALKNDTIGFFGPVGWGEIVDGEASFAVTASADRLARRAVYFERWPFEALAEMLSRDEALRPFMRPRTNSLFLFEGGVLHGPVGEVPLTADRAAVMAKVDGTRTARQIAAELGPERDEESVFAALRGLAKEDLVMWSFSLSTGAGPAMLELRALLEAIEPALRARPLAMLDELEARRLDVVAAAGDAAALRTALTALDATFERLTGLPAVRRGGQNYAARTLVHEDCVRDARVVIGQQALSSLSGPLGLVLSSYRWLTARFGVEYRRLMLAAFEQAQQMFSLEEVPVMLLWPSIEGIMPTRAGVHPELAACIRDLQSRWAELLGVDPNSPARRVEARFADVEARALASFAAPAPGWPLARYHCPDVMLAASSLEELREGRFQFVLGEVHLGTNTLECPLFYDQRDAPGDYLPTIGEELGGRVSFVIAPEVASSRYGGCATSHPDDVLVEWDATKSSRPPSQTVPVSALVASRRGDTVFVRTRDGAREWDVLAFLEQQLEYASVDLLPQAPHVPRVTMDHVVLTRESWTFEASALDFARGKGELARFSGARSWAASHGIPGRVFVKASAELKPFFVDFESPLAVEALCHAARRSTKVRITEMLPEVEQCWLEDEAGQKYTSELRFVVLDERPAFSALSASSAASVSESQRRPT